MLKHLFDFKEVKVMSGKNHLLIFLLCLTIILTGLSIVSAADLNSTEVDDSGDVIVSIDEEALSDNTKTFKDLNHDINDNTKSKIYLKSDYTFNSKNDSNFVEGIKITRKVTIDGKGHTLDGNNNARIFMVKNKYDYQNGQCTVHLE